MGLLLSVLVACVGVIELIAFYHNVKRNVTLRPTCGDLSVISEGYIQGLYDVRKRIVNDIQNLQKDSSPPTSSNYSKKNVDTAQRPLPAFRLNSHEDIEIELNKNVVARSRSTTPRRYLVKERDVDAKDTTRSASPRRFVVSEEPQGLQKSKCKTSLPEYFIQQQINLEKSPNHPRYVLKTEGGYGPSIPLPKQFVVTETELDASLFEDASSKISDDDSLSSSAEYYRRSPSPYPPLELPHTTRNNVNKEVNGNSNSVVEEDEELYKSRSPSPNVNPGSSNLTSIGCRQKETVVLTERPLDCNDHGLVFPNKKDISATKNLEESRSKTENHISQNIFFQSIQTHSQLSEKQENDLFSTPTSSFEEIEENIILENTSFDENCLNSLDGVSKQKSIRRSCNSRRSIRRKNNKDNSLDKSGDNSDIKLKSQKLPDTSNVQKTTTEPTKSQHDEVASTSKTAENKTPEPFWVNH